MKCTFLGVGEAFDEELPNTSLLVFDGSGSVMLDCGFTAAPQLWRCMPHPVRLDAVWISHFHGDHWFGLPWLLARMHEEGRDKPLTVAGQREVGHRVKALAETAYPGLLDKLNFRLVFRELESGESAELGGFSVRCAVGEHSLRNQAIRLDSSHGSVFYSGDGRPTSQRRSLPAGATFWFRRPTHYMDRQSVTGPWKPLLKWPALRSRKLWRWSTWDGGSRAGIRERSISSLPNPGFGPLCPSPVTCGTSPRQPKENNAWLTSATTR